MIVLYKFGLGRYTGSPTQSDNGTCDSVFAYFSIAARYSADNFLGMTILMVT